jgi:hypothetical protein
VKKKKVKKMKTRKNCVIIAIALLSLIALVASAQALPDLTVSNAYLNPGDKRANETVRAYINQSNDITAVVENTAAYDGGANDTGPFDVCFAVRNSTTIYKIGCADVASLAGNNGTTVSITWTPTCDNFSAVLSEFPYTSEEFWLNVTADCKCSDCPNCPAGGANGVIAESDENNNKLATFVDDIQASAGTTGLIGGVVFNGYKAKPFACSDPSLDEFNYNGTVITGGGVTYNASGRGETTLVVGASDTLSHTITIPGGGTSVKEARLYVYWYDNWDGYKTQPEGYLADLSVDCQRISDGSWLNFTNAMGTKYTDAKGFEKYQNPKGTYAYNVTSLVTASGSYNVTLTNTGATVTKPFGTLLLVVYENANAHKTTQLWWLEGNDYLMAADETHGGYRYHVSPEESTATVTFAGAVNNPADVTKATLLSVVAQGHTADIDMLFNGAVIEEDAWNADSEACPESRVHIESKDVTASLVANNNNMGFKDTGSNGMQAVGAFLILQTGEECLGNCTNNDDCSGTPVYTDVNCTFCLDRTGNWSWDPTTDCGKTPWHCNASACVNHYVDDPDGTGQIVGTGLFDCPQCADESDNDADGKIDCADPECLCCCDDTENSSDPEHCVPELATVVLFGVGLLTLAGYVHRGRRRK